MRVTLERNRAERQHGTAPAGRQARVLSSNCLVPSGVWRAVRVPPLGASYHPARPVHPGTPMDVAATAAFNPQLSSRLRLRLAAVEPAPVIASFGMMARRPRSREGRCASPHATRWPMPGHDTRSLQAYLGHKNIQHTVRYTELSPARFKDFLAVLVRRRVRSWGYC